MINKDYILRISERIGRTLAIILGLRKLDKNEEALLTIDDVLLSSTGMTSRFLNALSEELLQQMLSPLGKLNTSSAYWIASMLKVEGDIYIRLGDTKASYYRYLKSLHLYLALLLEEPGVEDTEVPNEVNALLTWLSDYEIPVATQQLLFAYYDYKGLYGRAEDLLFELLKTYPSPELFAKGRAFYERLGNKSAADLAAGNLSHEEVEESLEQLTQMQNG